MSDRIQYGRWFEKKSPGIFKLTLQGTIGLVAGIMLIIYVGGRANNIWVTVGMITALVVFEVFFGWEYDGKTLARRRGEHRDLPKRAKRGEDTYLTGVMGALEGNHGGHPLPGVLAQTKLLRGTTGHGDPFDVIHYPSKGLFVAVLRTYPDGTSMNDQDLTNHMVAKYGAWTALLPVEDGIVGAQVVVDSARSTGVQLRESIRTERSPHGPTEAATLMDEIGAMLPNHSGAEITAYAAIVWRQSAMSIPITGPEDVVVEIAKKLPHHMEALAAAGAGDPIPMLEPELVETARLAYDPDTAEAFDELRVRGHDVELSWADAGPSFGAETRTEFRHDGGASFTLEMRKPPRGLIFDNHLTRLLRPNPVFLRKRVAIFYEAVPLDKAQSQAENAVRAEDFQAGQKKGRVTATTRRDLKVAQHLDDEIAQGAALVPFAMLATCTYPDTPEAESAARNTLKTLMTSSRMRVRQSKGLQAALFHMTLPFGILPWEFADNPFKK